MSIVDTLYSVSTNPLVLLLAGAGISGLLIPYFTRRWQDRQEELKIKAELILQFSKAVTETIRAIESTEDKSGEQMLFKQHCRDVWSERIPEIGAQIHTYFQKSRKKIPHFWENYKRLIDQFCKLSLVEDAKTREDILLEINLYLTNLEGDNVYQIKPDEVRKALRERKLPVELSRVANKSNNDYTEQWNALRGRIFDLKHDLMKRIIESSMAGFSRGLIGFLTRR
jgi:hypothetical protein